MPVNSRVRLPYRRECETLTIQDFGGKPLDVSIGLDPRHRVREVFVDGHKIGSDAEANIDDGLVLASVLLQSGHSIQELAKLVGRESIVPGAPAASLVGLVIETAAKMEESQNVGATQ